MCHSAEDLAHIFNQIQGPDPNDSNCIDFSQLHAEIYRDEDKSRVMDSSILPFSDLERDSCIDLSGLKIGVVEEYQISELDDRNKSIQK